MPKLLVIATVLAVSTCTVRDGPPAEEPILEGLRPQFVCLAYTHSGVCARSEWRCSRPLMLTHADTGRPRCIMPGSE
jgi:hypothetical protein